jgi:ribosomal protein S1
MNDPWKDVNKKYQVGQQVTGKVLKLNPFGAFVELDKDIHGLIHISELSDKQLGDPSEIIKEGETGNFVIISIEPENHRLGLSLKKAKEKKKENAEEKTETAETNAEKPVKASAKKPREKKAEKKEEKD